ncbi:MAG TPA: exodeoxyribonuclease V subunit gamma [Polyangiaceae bacterium]
MQVHRSHRMERLVDVLAEVVRAPVGDALEPETILIQSKGMERWLSNQLALRHGVFANARFPFPRGFIDEVFDAVVPDLEPAAGSATYSREVLTFAILTLLPGLLADPAFAPLHGYLEDDAEAVKRVELAERIAHVFDQYLVYRPRLLLKWEKGQGADWQAKLWRALRKHLGGQHFASRAQRFFQEWSPLLVAPGVLPRRVSIVGVSALPPIYLKILDRISERCDIQLFLLSPSPEYFAQLRSLREVGRGRKGPAELAFDDPAFDDFQGNPLLASFGRTGREFQFTLERDTLYRETERDLFASEPGATLLEVLQQDIVALHDRSGPDAVKHELAAGDRSLQVVSCHSPMREVEVLRDQLLGMLDDDPTLEPGDILVMSPNIEAYAPLIDAVFGVDPRDPLQIPYRITDKSERASNLYAKALLQLLAVVSGRVTASEVLDLLQQGPVQRQLGIDASEVPDLGLLIHQAGIRWGIDATHRERFAQPARAKNTWRFGLERLLLGVALPADGDTLFAGAAPAEDVEGDSAALVGKLAALLETLTWACAEVVRQRSVADWVGFVRELCRRALAIEDREAWQERAVFELTQALAESAARAGFHEAISLAPIVDRLTAHFETERVSHQFLAGGITFCALLPMRSIPFRVIALLGMNDGEFPRTQTALSFDLMAEDPEPGDRSLKDEDRYLFLEAILSARQCLLVSYVGRGVQDNAELPPSPVVSELVDYATAAFLRNGTRVNLVTEHPLQPFNPHYFRPDSAPLFSFSSADARGAEALSRYRSAPEPFLQAPLNPIEQRASVDLEELIRFYQNPARGFLQNRLGVFLEGDPRLVEDREPIELDPLEQHELGMLLLDRALKEPDDTSLQAFVEATGVLPDGTVGSLLYQDTWRAVRHIADRARPWLVGPRKKPHPVSVDCNGTRVTGHLRQLYASAQLYWQYARVKPKNELALWLRHLAWMAGIRSSGVPSAGHPGVCSVLVGRRLEEALPGSATCVFDPLPSAEARAELAELVALYHVGHETPLPLFPAASKVYVEQLLSANGNADATKALTKARDEFLPSYGAAFSEGSDPYVVRAFQGTDPLASAAGILQTRVDFSSASLRVFEPMLKSRRSEVNA